MASTVNHTPVRRGRTKQLSGVDGGANKCFIPIYQTSIRMTDLAFAREDEHAA